MLLFLSILQIKLNGKANGNKKSIQKNLNRAPKLKFILLLNEYNKLRENDIGLKNGNFTSRIEKLFFSNNFVIDLGEK